MSCEDEEPTSEDLKQAQSQDEVLRRFEALRSSPPEDPRAAAFIPAQRLAEHVIAEEVSPERREAVTDEYRARIDMILDRMSGHATWGEQMDAAHDALEDAKYSKVDLRKLRTSRGVSNEKLLADYEILLPQLKVVFASESDPAARARLLAGQFVRLQGRDLFDAVQQSPSRAACIVLARRHYLSADRVRDRLTRGRKERRI